MTGADTENDMRLADYLLRANVVFNLAFNSKRDLLHRLAALAAEKAGVEKRLVENALNAREGLGSTGIGHGIAIPHATVEGIDHPVCIFTKLSRPLEFEAVDGVPVDLVLLLISPPGKQEGSLSILSAVAHRLKDDARAAAVRQASSAEETYLLMVGSFAGPS